MGRKRLFGTIDGLLVTDGVYALTRNPQNVGYLALLLGGAIARRSAPGTAAHGGAVPVLDRWIPVEERHLRWMHGTAYDEYAGRTPNVGWTHCSSGPAAHWIPRLELSRITGTSATTYRSGLSRPP